MGRGHGVRVPGQPQATPPSTLAVPSAPNTSSTSDSHRLLVFAQCHPHRLTVAWTGEEKGTSQGHSEGEEEDNLGTHTWACWTAKLFPHRYSKMNSPWAVTGFNRNPKCRLWLGYTTCEKGTRNAKGPCLYIHSKRKPRMPQNVPGLEQVT